MSEAAEAEFPGLFCHRTRADWGVSVFAGERDGKRTYLFEGGEERVMGSGAHDMMLKITALDANQRRTLARLTALVLGRRNPQSSTKTTSAVLLEQLTRLRGAFPEGLVDVAWQNTKRAAHARETLVPQAQELLSLKTVDALIKAQQLDTLWSSASKLLVATGWLPAAHLEPAPAAGVGLLASAMRELLHGSAAIDQRVDRFSIAFETAFRHPPRWETVTGLLTLVFPDSHVLVEQASFRKQLRTLGFKGALPQTPNGAGYVRCLNVSRIVASKLTEHGEVPQDLLDVHDFIRFTLKASAPARRPKAPKNKTSGVEANDADDSE